MKPIAWQLEQNTTFQWSCTRACLTVSKVFECRLYQFHWFRFQKALSVRDAL